MTRAALLIAILLALSAPLPAETVDVMSHGWHTGIVIPVNARSTELIPALRHFQNYRWAELSWGDEGFFRAQQISPGVTLHALLWPTPTVLHIDGFGSPSIAEYEESTLVRFELTDRAFDDLCRSIAADFEETEPLSAGVYETSKFFRAKGRYTFVNTCNVWTLRKLQSAGLTTNPGLGIRAEVAMRQIADQGSVLRPPRREPKWPYVIASLVALGLAIRLRRNRSALEEPPRDRHLRRAWAVIGISTGVMFLATLLVANHYDGARTLVRIGLMSFTGGLMTVAVVAADRLRPKRAPTRRSRVIHVFLLIFAVLTIAVILSPM